MTGEEIKAIRKAEGLTQTEFARLLRVSFTSVNRWERGHNKPLPDRIERIRKIVKKSLVTLTPLEFAEAIRMSRPDSVEWFTTGGCWEFFVLCRRYFKDAEPLYDQIVGHVAVRIGEEVFDITGRVRKRESYKSQSAWFWKTRRPYRWVRESMKERKHG